MDTLVPQAIAGLTVVGKAAWESLGLHASWVFDGRPMGTVPDEYLTIAYTSQDVPDVSGTASGLDSEGRSEFFDVLCELSTAKNSGDGNLTAQTERAGELLGAFGEALRADQDLNGLLANGGSADRTGAYTWQREVTESGSFVTVTFSVRVYVGYIE